MENQQSSLLQSFGQPQKAVIWFGNPYMPWHDSQIPGGKWGQELTINIDGSCTSRSLVFNDYQRRPIAGQPTEYFQVAPVKAASFLKRILVLLNYFGSRSDGSNPSSTLSTTIWSGDGDSWTFNDYPTDEPVINQLAMEIRDCLNRADLMALDGNGREDFIEEFVVNYEEDDGYQEQLVLTRVPNAVTYRRQFADGPVVTTTFQWPESELPLLDRLNPVDFTATIPGIPANAAEDNGQLGHFNCLIKRRILPAVRFSGDYERYCLPAPWADLMHTIDELLDIPTTGALLNSNYYTRRRRCLDEAIYIGVKFFEDGREYNYLTDDDTIRPGDSVLVPVGEGDSEQALTVTSKHYYKRSEVPYPLDKVKRVIKKVDEEEKQ